MNYGSDAVVESLAEKIHECPLNRGRSVYNRDGGDCRLYGVSAIQGLLLKRMEGQSGISELSVILWLSVVHGC